MTWFSEPLADPTFTDLCCSPGKLFTSELVN